MTQSARVPDDVSSFSAEWPRSDEMTAVPANQMLAQIGIPGSAGIPDGIYLAFGNVTPPILIGEDEETIRRAAQQYGGKLRVHPLGRFLLTKQNALELIRILSTAVEQYDFTVQLGQERGQVPNA